jgi:catabolite regulation protein CreA
VNLIAETAVIQIEAADDPQSMRVTCEMPSINSQQYEQGETKLSLVLKRTPLISGIPQLNIKVT